VTVAAVVLAAVDALPPAVGWRLPGLAEPSAAFHGLLGQVPRIVLASLIAYWAGEFSNSYLLAKMKLLTRGRWLWSRTIGSTLVGEGVDTAGFILIAFAGVYQPTLLAALIVSNYLFKVGVEVVFTPVTYAVVTALKRAENEDYYDWRTRFNPFLLRLE
ncbi:MAG: queuosine precursor transporter, partial [Phycisphaerae bacterium]